MILLYRPALQSGVGAGGASAGGDADGSQRVILCETDRHEELPKEVGSFRLIKTRRYGKAMIHTYRVLEEE